MASKNSKKTLKTFNRLPINIKITKEDLDDEGVEEISPSASNLKEKDVPSKPIKKRIELASSIQTGFDDIGLYVDVNPVHCKPSDKSDSAAVVNQRIRDLARRLTKPDKLMEKTVLKPGFEKLESIPRYDEGVRRLKAERRKEADKTKGDKWFNLPATEMTDEKLRDLEIIKMRSILNPKQFYKKNDLKVVPKYFQVGKVVDTAAEFYNNRVLRKDRKKTLVDELMVDANFQRYNKRKYSEIIQVKQPSHGPRQPKKNSRPKK